MTVILDVSLKSDNFLSFIFVLQRKKQASLKLESLLRVPFSDGNSNTCLCSHDNGVFLVIECLVCTTNKACWFSQLKVNFLELVKFLSCSFPPCYFASLSWSEVVNCIDEEYLVFVSKGRKYSL